MSEELEQWRRAGFGIVLTGAGGEHTGFHWVCSILVSHADMATGANDDPDTAIRTALTQARKRWPEVQLNER